MSDYRYPWPASCLTAVDMKLLHDARESSPDRTTITELVARAVRAQYGRVAINEFADLDLRSRERRRLRPLRNGAGRDGVTDPEGSTRDDHPAQDDGPPGAL